MWKKSHGVILLGFLTCDNNIFIQKPMKNSILNNIMVLYDFKNNLLLSFVLVGVCTYIGKKGKRKWTSLFSMNSKHIYILPLKNICKFIAIILVVKDNILIINDTFVLQNPIVALDKWQKNLIKKDTTWPPCGT
jgi:hypothetical protein